MVEQRRDPDQLSRGTDRSRRGGSGGSPPGRNECDAARATREGRTKRKKTLTAKKIVCYIPQRAAWIGGNATLG
jgi:hypothetical protein